MKTEGDMYSLQYIFWVFGTRMFATSSFTHLCMKKSKK